MQDVLLIPPFRHRRPPRALWLDGAWIDVGAYLSTLLEREERSRKETPAHGVRRPRTPRSEGIERWERDGGTVM